MDAFTAAFPTVRQTVKMHLLEDQTKELVQATKMGFGIMGEQGAEAIHEQLQLHSEQGGKAQKSHAGTFLNLSPQLQSLRTPQAKRKKKLVRHEHTHTVPLIKCITWRQHSRVVYHALKQWPKIIVARLVYEVHTKAFTIPSGG